MATYSNRVNVTLSMTALDMNEKPTERSKTVEFLLHGATWGDQQTNLLEDITDYVTALEAISQARVTGWTVSFSAYVFPLPTLLAGDIYKEAIASVFVNPAGKKATVSVPAPIDEIMSVGVPDRNNALFQTFIMQYNQYAMLSDGEQVIDENFIDSVGVRWRGRKSIIVDY